MIPTLLAELTRLEEGATKGPWIDIDCYDDEGRIIQNGEHGIGGDHLGLDMLNTDTEFIVALRNAFPSLRDELLRLRAENEKMREALESISVMNNWGYEYARDMQDKANQALTLASMLVNLAKNFLTVREERDHLRQRLEKYGRHEHHCEKEYQRSLVARQVPVCSCGFSESQP